MLATKAFDPADLLKDEEDVRAFLASAEKDPDPQHRADARVVADRALTRIKGV